MAALVASKVFYHLEALDDSLRYALCAGEAFNVSGKTEYVETLLAKCIDEYIRLRIQESESKQKGGAEEKTEPIDPRLISIVDQMFERCYAHHQFEQALGIAVESRRLDQVARCIKMSGDVQKILSYCLKLCKTTVHSRRYRNQLLQVMVQLYKGLKNPDYLNMCQCLLFLNDSESVAATLDKLISGDTDKAVLAYQVAFDLNENQNQPFLLRVRKKLSPEKEGNDKGEDMQVEKPENSSKGSEYEDRLKKLKDILSGKTPTDLYLHFLYTHSKTDLLVLKSIKDRLKPRNTVTHIATVMSHSIMNSGTTIDTFLRDNLQWLAKATNWSKFTATASIGVIHRGHYKESLKLLQPYLPSGNAGSGSPYQEGGALYALGLIHACDGGEQASFLMESLKSKNEIVQHGASLGLGLTTMATGDKDIFDMLFEIVVTDNAVSGEAASIAAGLTMLGTGYEDGVENLLGYAHDTKHEKIIRGIAMAIALIQFGREEAADPVIDELGNDKDAILRYGAMYTIALAYVGTANNKAVRKLLHVAVSDVSDDVRRAATTALGFVLCNEPTKVPTIVSLLAEGFNPHVRYGAAMAVGIACAGSGMKEALDLLEALLDDPEEFVRQAAFIATAMVLIQHNKKKEPRVESFRKKIDEALWAKGDTMAKFGAIISAGILDAGGRNVTISLLSQHGHKKMTAIVGMALFPQFWYWHPLIHFLCLSFTPTAVIGLNKDLKMPKNWTVKSNAPPSMFSYPEPRQEKKEEKKVLKTATLSVAKKKKADKPKKDGDMDVEGKAKKEEAKKEGEKMEVEEGKEEAGKTEEKEKPEPNFEILENPSRVTWAQQEYIENIVDQRYKPAKETITGIVMLIDNTPQEKEDFVVAKAPKIGVPGVSEDEPDPPEPFEFLR
uniref:26S proteasome regulatory subunit RPN2 C-terminal domain-containing protein n=1 Tax=Lotharella globosa TaxID=91324 RepID=A0A7S4DW45_9EUKA